MDKGTYKLFEATEINGIKLANRFVRSATWPKFTIAYPKSKLKTLI